MSNPNWDEYYSALLALHLKAGAPSSRTIKARAGGEISHATVNDVLHGRRLPGWRTLELIVQALDGDLDEFRRLWGTMAVFPVRPEPSRERSEMLAELVKIRELLELILQK